MNGDATASEETILDAKCKKLATLLRKKTSFPLGRPRGRKAEKRAAKEAAKETSKSGRLARARKTTNGLGPKEDGKTSQRKKKGKKRGMESRKERADEEL